MDWLNLANINLRAGKGGGDPRKGLCIMEMVSWFDGADTVTDHPSCACPALTRYAIGINDAAPSQEDRNTLKPLLPLLSGSRDESAKARRADYIVRQTVLRIVAPLFAERWPQHADAMRSAAESGSMMGLRDAAADAAADAASGAAYDAAYAASRAAAAAYAAKRQSWLTQKAILEEAIMLGAHGGLDLASVPAREAELVRVLERA